MWLGNDGTHILELLSAKKACRFSGGPDEGLASLTQVPKVRIVTVFVLMLSLSVVQYGDRRRTHKWVLPVNATKVRSTTCVFAFIFTVANFVASDWKDVPTNLLGIRIGCSSVDLSWDTRRHLDCVAVDW